MYWEANGNVYALTQSGDLKYATILPADSQANYKVKKVQIITRQESLIQQQKMKGKLSIKKKTPLWEWPFKVIWWSVKVILRILQIGDALGIDGSDKDKK